MKRNKNKLGAFMIILFFLATNVSPKILFDQRKYLSKPINFLVGYPPGEASEVSDRALVTITSKIPRLFPFRNILKIQNSLDSVLYGLVASSFPFNDLKNHPGRVLGPQNNLTTIAKIVP
jgi:hypothetical protein